MTRPSRKSSLLPGTLDMLVLRTLSVAPLHGYAIAQHIARLSNGVLAADQGSLYPALERLQRQGWVRSRLGKSPTGRNARYYTLTSSGRRQLGDEVAGFERVLRAIRQVMEGT
jgi:PadR family transcriptional regulator PadR